METALPPTFDAGSTVKFTRTWPSYPASSGWILKLYLSGKVGRTYTATTNANGIDYDFVLPATGAGVGTDGLNQDTYGGLTYNWTERVEKAGENYVVAKGEVTVQLDPSAAAAGVAQTPEEKELAIIDAAIAGRLTEDMETYQFEGRAVSRIPVPELYKIRRNLRATINAQRHKGRFSAPIRMSFNSPR